MWGRAEDTSCQFMGRHMRRYVGRCMCIGSAAIVMLSLKDA